MKYFLLLLILAGCASKPIEAPMQLPNQRMVVDSDVQPMSRNEIIIAVKECESNGLRAVTLIAKRKINGFTTDIVADVTCAPLFKY